ncbi:MAG TPA: wax ester/triacylglycerol synthase domain-containing protein [Nocardioidaceae bacterium]|nr:wax ester/triacylglycerol synthase domain-containing protein [Nocardioidaceae bacterium]
MNEFLSNSDAFAYSMESDARLRSTVVSIVLLDRSPDWDVLTDRLERVARQVPMFRQRIVASLPPAPPRWVDDTDFELRYHLARVVAPAPGDLQTVLEMARHAAMEEFDHARPMWNVTLVEGLQDGEAALLVKLHHSLADGIGGVQIAQLVFDLTPEPADLGPLPPMPVPEQRGVLDGVRHSAAYDVQLLRRAVTGAASGPPRALLRGVRHPLSTVRDVADTAASIYRTVRPINDTASPVMRQRRMIRELGVLEVPKRQLRAAGHAGGGSLNDAFLAAVTGGLKRYHALHSSWAEELRVTMPISIREEGDATGGNRITLMRFSLPIYLHDPAERIAHIHQRAQAAQHERSLPYTQLIAGGLNLLPRWYVGAILRHVDFLASDVPGVPVPVYVGGAKVTLQYAFGPTIGAGVNITLMTYCDTCAIGINADTGAIPDLEAFRECLREGFDEVLSLAGVLETVDT